MAVAEITQIKGSMSDLARLFEQGILTDAGHIYFEERPLWGEGRIGNIRLHSRTARPDPELKQQWAIINTAHNKYFDIPDGTVIAVQTVTGRLQLHFYLLSHPIDKAAASSRLIENAIIIHKRLVEAGFLADTAVPTPEQPAAGPSPSEQPGQDTAEKIRRLYYEGKSDVVIGHSVGLGESRVKQIRLDMGLKRRPGRKN